MTDIVEKLRGPFCRRPHGTTIDTKEICERLDAAADEIELLRFLLKDREAEIERFQILIYVISSGIDAHDIESEHDESLRGILRSIRNDCARALSSKESQSSQSKPTRE